MDCAKSIHKKVWTDRQDRNDGAFALGVEGKMKEKQKNSVGIS